MSRLMVLTFDDQPPGTPTAAQGREALERNFAALQQRHPGVPCWRDVAELIDLAYVVARVEQQSVSYADFMERVTHHLSRREP